ncbi:MAG: HEPN domain-containing protein [Cyanobacteria bacterium J06621_3]
MSVSKLHREAARWYRQAEDDLSAASALLSAKQYAQSCFLSQQSAEKALKGVGYLLDTDPWGHSCTKLIGNLPAEEKKAFEAIVDDAKALDKLYIPTRYPDSLAELTPSEAFTGKDADAAIASAQTILSRARTRIYSTLRDSENTEESEDESTESVAD